MFPVNFFVGGLVGAVVTYVYKDEQAKQWVSDTSKKVKEGGQAFVASFRKKEEAAVATETPVQTEATTSTSEQATGTA